MSKRLTTRLSYTASEVGGQLIFCVISFYLLKFYTDVYGISPEAAGSILLIARCVDAFDAPLWGVVFERTHSRWGKSRPWFLWLCIPFAVFGVLTFCSPHLNGAAKIAYAAATYVISSVLYTGINTPVTAILAALTRDGPERVTLTTWRMFGSKAGVLFVNLTVLHLVAWLGHGNNRKGFMLVMPIYAVGSVVLFLTAFRNLRETVHERKQRIPVRKSFCALKNNGPWLIIFLSSLFFWIAFIARITTSPYFFEYVMHRPGLTSIANSLDVISLGSIFFLPWLCRRFAKTHVWATSLVLSALAQLIVGFGTGRLSVAIVLAGWVLGFLASGIAMAMPFSILSDSIDYGEWKSGIRAAGLLTAIGAAFCLKAGSGLGGALSAWILALTHYIPNMQQTQRAIFGIDLSFVWLPAIGYAIAALPVFFYHRYECMEVDIQRELEERRKVAAILSEAV